MPKHNPRNVIESVRVQAAPQEEVPETSRLTLRVDANYSVTGRISGQKYVFNGAGASQDVNKEDVEWLLSLRQGKGCCGGGEGNTIFELSGE